MNTHCEVTDLRLEFSQDVTRMTVEVTRMPVGMASMNGPAPIGDLPDDLRRALREWLTISKSGA